jgi:hypothetical protein
MIPNVNLSKLYKLCSDTGLFGICASILILTLNNPGSNQSQDAVTTELTNDRYHMYFQLFKIRESFTTKSTPWRKWCSHLGSSMQYTYQLPCLLNTLFQPSPVLPIGYKLHLSCCCPVPTICEAMLSHWLT